MNFPQVLTINDSLTGYELKNSFSEKFNISENDFYILQNGKIVKSDTLVRPECNIHVILRLIGGKGGFGSMLRAIGAQIEKTTNREACRDLSGRRLRDINEEKRLKNWIASQAEREQEALDRKQKKLERLCYQPKHKFEDAEYDKLRSQLPEKVSDAVEEGFKAAASTVSNTNVVLKRKADNNKSNTTKNKKKKLWVDADLSCSEDSDLDFDDDCEKATKNENTVKPIQKLEKCETVTSATC